MVYARMVKAGFRGFVSPQGEKFSAQKGEDHNDLANRLLRKFHKNENYENDEEANENGVYFANTSLEIRDWVRVVDDGLYSVWRLNYVTLNRLKDLLSELPDNHQCMLGISIGDKLLKGTATELLEKLGNY